MGIVRELVFRCMIWLDELSQQLFTVRHEFIEGSLERMHSVPVFQPQLVRGVEFEREASDRFYEIRVVIGQLRTVFEQEVSVLTSLEVLVAQIGSETEAKRSERESVNSCSVAPSSV